MDKNYENMYIVLSQSGSFISNMLKFFTKSQYNHVSISLYPDLRVMYSFGRRFAYYPFWSGLVAESLDWGTFKRFSNAEILVLEAAVPKNYYNTSVNYLYSMFKQNKKYGYNYIGVCLSYFNIYKKFKTRYYCSEFVREILQKANALGSERLLPITYPSSFLQINEFRYIYKGKLKDYVLTKTI